MREIIIGIDPGSCVTGYGVVAQEKSQVSYIASGSIVIKGKLLAERMRQIFLTLQQVCQNFQPSTCAIEQVFIHKNPQVLKLGQARGAAIAAVATLGLDVNEYSARQVKQSLVGYGGAAKVQIQHMVKVLLSVEKTFGVDEADALAIAICHAHSKEMQAKFSSHPLINLPRFRRGRMR